MESVYSAVRTDSLYKADYVSSLKGSFTRRANPISNKKHIPLFIGLVLLEGEIPSYAHFLYAVCKMNRILNLFVRNLMEINSRLQLAFSHF